MRLLNAAWRLFASILANTALVAVSAGLAVGAVGLTALYLVKHIDETPALKTLQCMAGFSRPYCTNHEEEVAHLKSELAALTEKTARAENKLANLQAIESAVDEVTLFETHDDPNSALDVTVGTIYSRLLEPDMTPKYFCYVQLSRGTANENRNLYIQGLSGPVDLSRDDLRRAGVSEATLNFGRSVCKPFLIGRSG